MSFTDDIGNAWDSLKDSVVPAIGGAFSAIGQGQKAYSQEAPASNAEAAKVVGDALAAPVNVAQRGIATAMLNNPGIGGNPVSFEDWKKAWNLAGAHMVDGKQVEGISVGQIVSNQFLDQGPGGLGLNNNLTDTGASADARHQAFSDSWFGRASSGTVDILTGGFVDPLAYAGKAAGIVGKGAAELSGEHVAEAFAVSRGELAASAANKTAAKKAADIDQIIADTHGNTAAENYALPLFKNSTAGGTLAYLFSRADQEADKAIGSAGELLARNEADALKRTLLGTLFGDAKSMEALQTEHDLLANELRRMVDTPPQTWAVQNFDWEDGGQGLLFDTNKDAALEYRAQQARISNELARMNEIIANEGTQRTLRGTAKEQIGGANAQYQMRSTVLYSGAGNRPIVLTAGAISNRLEGHINVKDAENGYRQFDEFLNQARTLPEQDKLTLRNRFLGASTQSGRQSIVIQAERAMVRSVAETYGVTPKQVEMFITAGEGRRSAVMNLMKSRLYTASDDSPLVTWQDWEDDVIHAVDKKIMSSQGEAFTPILDPRQVERTLRANSQNRMLEIASDHFFNRPGIATAFYKPVDALADMGSSALNIVTKMWKDSALIARAPAYLARAQLDSQSRMAAIMGVHHSFMAATKSVPALWRYYAGIGDRTLSADDRMIKALSPWLQQAAGFSEDEAGMVIRDIASSGGQFSDLVNATTDKAIENARAAGDWGEVDPKDRNWFPSWVRGVDRQIRRSPTAMKVVEGRNRDYLIDFITHDPDGIKEWNEVREGLGNDVNRWIDMLSAHVDDLLPTTMLRDWALRGTRGNLDEMAAEKLGAMQELKEKLILDLGVQVPAHGEIKDIVAAGQDEVARAKQLHLDARDRRDQLLNAKREAKRTKSEWTPQQEDQLTEAQHDVRMAYATRNAKSAALGKARQAEKEARKGATATEAEARTVQEAQTATANPERPAATWSDVEEYFTRNAGENRMPVHGTSYTPKEQAKGWATYEKLRTAAYNNISDAPETVLSRMPLFIWAFNKHLGETLERLGGEDALTAAEVHAARIAAVKVAKQTIKRVLFDTSDVSNLAHTFRFISPFYAAWEDTMKKWGNLIYENPNIGERVRWTLDGLHNSGQRDDNNNIIVPMSWIPKSIRDAFNLGTGWRLDPDSANSIFQGEPWWLPGAGPLVELTTDAAAQMFFPDKGDSPLVKFLLPYGYGEGPLQDFAPAWMRHYIDAYQGSIPWFGDSKVFKEQLAIVGKEWEVSHPGEKPDQGKLRQIVRNRLIMRGAMSQVLPFSISPDNELQFYMDQAHVMQQDYQKAIKSPEYKALVQQYKEDYGDSAMDRLYQDHKEYRPWLDQFMEQYPGYGQMAVGISVNDSGLVATNRAVSAAQRYKDIIAAHPDQAWLIVGDDNAYGLTPDTQYSQNAHQYEVNQGLRSYKDPADAIRDADVQVGWATYMKNRTAINVELDNRGLKSLNSKGAEDLREAWKAFVRDLSKHNGAWGAAYANSDNNQAQETLNTASELFAKHPELPKNNNTMRAMQLYIENRNEIMGELANRGYGTLATKGNQDLSDAWEGFVSQLRQWSPGFEQIWNRSLQKDQLNTEIGDVNDNAIG